MSSDKATILGGAGVEVVADGPCLSGTLEQLALGVAAKPMPEPALVKVRADAVGFLGAVVEAYQAEVAQGEVGASGTGRASLSPPSSGRCPTGLLYGRVQSGKTVAMISFCAAAIDNGFRVIVVLTSDFVKLVEQTADRFAALDGPLIKNSVQSDNWPHDREHVKKNIAKHGVVFICTKNKERLTALVTFLGEIGAADYPALVLDDEADQATLDTTLQARSSGRAKASPKPSAIHTNIVQDEEGQSIRQMLRHHVFVQVTATPYALLLQSVDSDLRPTFTRLLEPGKGYTGGEAFFDVQHVEDGTPPLIFVEREESDQIEAADGGDPPIGLQRAIAFFLVAAGAQNVVDPPSRYIGQNFLCHTSQKTTEHARVANLIRGYVTRIADELDTESAESEAMMRLHWGHQELSRTMPDVPPLDAILAWVKKRLARRDVPVVNSANSPVEFGRQLNFIVGGNILGRGLTIDNLLVTYYLRRAKISQMDTVLQHARMYGYRQSLMRFTRVFLPEDLAARFHFIHVAEKNLRAQLAQGGASKITVETLQSLRATRLNVLDTQSLAAYAPGDHIYPTAPALDKKSLDAMPKIEASVRRAFGGSIVVKEPVAISMSALINLLPELPYGESDETRWDPPMLASVLRRIASRYQDRGFLYFRDNLRRKSDTFPTGALSGSELSSLRQCSGPVLCVFRDSGLKLMKWTGGRPFWYPTLVFPMDMPTHVFNVTG